MADSRTPNWMTEHRRLYLETDGAEGHVMDLRDVGGREDTTTLLIKTIGRQTGKTRITPLIYGAIDGNFVVIASKGGAPSDPSWFANMQGQEIVLFQVGEDHWEGSWYVAQGDERARIWSIMADYFPPYVEYERIAPREIPVVVLRPERKLAAL